ncbi:MAG: hypothetical protein CVV27_11290 [Candidatus Melainabacteria bacterium HGW-Melainabacteria-1]|nr:MAG: hypothetical protein CVV27_11290 [Candidatus Melainabacteria bacterium HGW-Melainabacteria-1]
MRGGLALGLTGLMLLGGLWSLVLDQAWLGGGIWTLSGLVLLPTVQHKLAELGLRIPPLASVLILVGGFLSGLLLMR